MGILVLTHYHLCPHISDSLDVDDVASGPNDMFPSHPNRRSVNEDRQTVVDHRR